MHYAPAVGRLLRLNGNTLFDVLAGCRRFKTFTCPRGAFIRVRVLGARGLPAAKPGAHHPVIRYVDLGVQSRHEGSPGSYSNSTG
eukprot:636632-Rhodomonas_salina.2